MTQRLYEKVYKNRVTAVVFTVNCINLHITAHRNPKIVLSGVTLD
ncbi:hypothetical protein LX66_2287 [Chitinophaga japonensis]|uniref:Uncharacterized protein n=1 Tax=Chitinophaga japonensis TaxID=104662 RepID=A0A562T3S8_CHIJA|nr:hypothetical protein LX66_2287 [Chitinophaga japonensis]